MFTQTDPYPTVSPSIFFTNDVIDLDTGPSLEYRLPMVVLEKEY